MKKYDISCKAKWTKTGFTQAFEGDIFEGKSKKEAIEKNLHRLWAIAMGNGWHCNVDYDKKQKAFKNSDVMDGHEAYNFIKENAKNLDEVLDILMEINPYDNCGYFIVTHDKKLQEASGKNWDDIFEDFCSEITHDSNKFMDLLKDEGY